MAFRARTIGWNTRIRVAPRQHVFPRSTSRSFFAVNNYIFIINCKCEIVYNAPVAVTIIALLYWLISMFTYVHTFIHMYLNKYMYLHSIGLTYLYITQGRHSICFFYSLNSLPRSL